jgi:thiol-disulfide isomerase/thioredoxin
MNRIAKTLILSLVFLLSSCSDDLSSSQNTSNETLKTLLKDSTKVAVIKFYADWCTSCKEYAPAFAKVSAKYSGKVDFISVDADDKANAALVKELKISRIPETVFVSADRSSVSKRLGPIGQESLERAIDKLIIGQ